jgi:hypothetical protein
MIKFIKIVFVLVISSNLIQAQGHQGGGGNMNKSDMPKDGVIKGVVMDNIYSTPVQFANVALFSIRDSSVVTGAVCDENGGFEIKELGYGRYYMSVSFMGYEKRMVENIKINPEQKLFDAGTIILNHVAQNIEEVEVIGEKSYVEYKIDRKVINISKNINASGGTLADALQNAPSIQVDVEGNVSLRGSTNFKVLIDGKPTVLDANEILQQIPVSSVENIEIITNPSAKYDPDGTTGIINIVMKKENKTGLSGIINATIGTGNKYSADFLLNYRGKKANYYIGGGWGDYAHSGENYTLRKTFSTSDTNFVETEGDQSHERHNYSVNGGIDLYLNDHNTLSFSGRYGYFGFSRPSVSYVHDWNESGTKNIYLINEGNGEMGGDFYSVNTDYTHNFKKDGHELSAAFYFSGRNGGNETFLDETITDMNYLPTGTKESYRTFQSRGMNDYRFKVDYVLPITETYKIEAGYQSKLDREDGDYQYEDLINDTWVLNDTISNELIFNEDVHSLYTTFSGSLIGINYMLGIRGEYTNRTVDQITSDEYFKIDTINFFPSIHLTKTLPKEQELQLSYTRRIERPRHWSLNPYPMYSDAYSVRKGNPELLPEYIDSYEFSYQKRIKMSSINVVAYFRQKNNTITQVQKPMDDGRFLYTFENIDKEYSYGTEISSNMQLAKMLMMYLNANVYRYNIESTVEGLTSGDKSFNYDLRANLTMMFSKTSRLQVNGFYNAPSVTVQGRRDGFFMAGLAFRQDFFKRKLSATLNVRDVLMTGERSSMSEGLNFYTRDVMTPESPVFTLSLSYKINNYKQKNGDKNDIIEDEGMM